MSLSQGSSALQINPMREVRLGKVVVNIAVGKSGEALEKAMKVLADLTGCKPCPRKAKKTIKTFGVRKGEPIACISTLRGDKAWAFLKRAFEAVRNRLPISAFDEIGNISFGVKEHIEVPGTKYDPNLGIYGFNVHITLERPGFRVKRRSLKRGKVGKGHAVTREEALSFVKDRFGVEVVEE